LLLSSYFQGTTFLRKPTLLIKDDDESVEIETPSKTPQQKVTESNAEKEKEKEIIKESKRDV